MKKTFLLLLWVLILCGITKATTINFDYWIDGNSISAPTEAPFLSITDEFAVWGIIFESTTKIVQHSTPGDLDTPPNCLFPDHTEDNITLDARFVLPTNPNVDATVPWVQFFQDRGAQSGGGTFIAYDIDGNEVINESFNTSGKTFHTFDDWGYVGEIHRIYIGYCKDGLDDLTFPTPVPEPPCWQEQAKLLASDGESGDQFGSSVSVSGGYIIVAAPYDDDNGSNSGSAYIFKRDLISGSWVQQAKLTASDGAAGDNFGSSVSISGDCAIVGARFADVNGVETGTAYIFRRSNTPSDPNWYQEAKLTAPDGAAGDAFGASVCVSGDNVIVGACQDDNANGTDSGSAYVFKHNGCSWSEIPGKLTASDGVARDGFGTSVSISGDHAIVGAYHFWHPVNEYPGSAYIFKRFGENWIEVDKLTASDAAARDEFGISVSVSGNYGVVGALLDDDAGTSSGSAYIFGSNNVDPNDWHEQTKLTALDADAGDVFGHSVSICGNYAIVGAHRDEDSGTDSGSAYIFKHSDASWIELAKLIASDGVGEEYFGISVSISNHYAVVGACLDDNENGTDSGSAYIFKNICNQAPDANAGDNIQIASAEQALTVIQGTATDPDADLLEYRWLEGEDLLLGWTAVGDNNEAYLDLGTLPPLSIGDHSLVLEVTDSKSTVFDEMILTVDNSPPEAQAAPNYQVVEIGIDPIIVVADVADFDGDELSYEWLKEGGVLGSGSVETVHGGNTVPIPDLVVPAGDTRFPVGVHSIELRVSDGINDDVNDFVSVEVTDTCSPSLSPVPSTTILWPPNHKLVPVSIWANAFDNGGGAIDLDVTVQSSEPPDADGDGNTIPDYYIDSVDDETGVIELRLAAERSGKGDGRTYTITITATDNCGNSSEGVVEILAPHDKRKK